MVWLTENKEIICKTFFVTGSLALFIGLGNYAYIYYKKTYKDNSKCNNTNVVDTNNVIDTNNVFDANNVVDTTNVDKNN